MALTQWAHRAAIALVIAAALVAVLLVGARYARAEEGTLAGRILCYINSVTGPPIPRFHVDECPQPPPPPPPAPTPACANGVDDDGDGLIDWSPLTGGDPGCATPLDTDETNTPVPPPPAGVENTLPLCSDGTDNDEDGHADLADADCAAFLPKLAVVKTVVNDNGGTASAADFILYIGVKGGSATTTVVSGATTTVSAGTWVVGEIQNAAYSGSFGGDCAASGEVTLAAGDVKTCAITNDDLDIVSPPPSTPPTGGGGSTVPAGGGGGGGGGGSIGIVAAASVAGALANAFSTSTIPAFQGSCDQYLTAFIRSGARNDESQVRRLQAVLRDYEGAPIAVTGAYDAATLAAVHALQAKYASEILAPWGARASTGYVYLTTRKKINEIYCRNARRFDLSAQELATIAQTRAKAQSPSPVAPGQSLIPPFIGVPKPPAETSSQKEETIGKSVVAPQTAAAQAALEDAAGKKSFWRRVLDLFRAR